MASCCPLFTHSARRWMSCLTCCRGSHGAVETLQSCDFIETHVNRWQGLFYCCPPVLWSQSFQMQSTSRNNEVGAFWGLTGSCVDTTVFWPSSWRMLRQLTINGKSLNSLREFLLSSSSLQLASTHKPTTTDQLFFLWVTFVMPVYGTVWDILYSLSVTLMCYVCVCVIDIVVRTLD